MSNVVEFAAFEEETAPVATPHRRLLRLSRGLSLLFAALTGLSLLWVVGAFAVIFFFADHVLIGAGGASLELPHPAAAVPGMIVLASQSFLTRLAGFVDILIAMAPVVFICLHLQALFGVYARGVVFARDNARHLKRVGLWLVLWPAAKLAANLLFRAAGGTDRAWAQPLLLYSLLLGLIVFAIAQVMEFGREIEQERDSFV
ncbi:MAG: DUF2975 domain-containing protein [Rhizomicrobium sp.]